MSELEERVDDIKEVHLALYLFNNLHLYHALLRIASSGARVVVTSLPLTGYDRRKIHDAEDVYNRVIEDGNIMLRVFPHMYVWYGARYAGGGASYSFHIKAGLIKYRDGVSKALITSGNLAPGDPTHSETAIFMEANRNYPPITMFNEFFNEIERRAVPFEGYHNLVQRFPQELQQLFDFSYVGCLNMVNFIPNQASHAFFTSPWITIGGRGSNHYAREKLVETISSARRRLLVCAQHSHDLSPFNGYPGETMISSITEAKRAIPGLDVRVLKQVASSGLADKRRAAFVEGHLYYAGVPQRVNRLVHDKFIIADETAVITTGNFTATQFGWGNRRMKFQTSTDDIKAVQGVIDSAGAFFGTPGGRVSATMTRPRKKKPSVKVYKNDIFSEVNAFLIIEDPKIANQLAEYFSRLWSHSQSSDVEIPT